MDSLLSWSLKSQHWLVIIGIILGILGTLYSAAGFLDKQHRFLSLLTQSFAFSITGGIIIGSALALIALLAEIIQDVLTHIFLQIWVDNLEQVLDTVKACLLIGITIGLVLGFIIGLRLHQKVQSIIAKRKPRWRDFFIWLGGGFLLTIICLNFFGDVIGMVSAALIGCLIGLITNLVLVFPFARLTPFRQTRRWKQKPLKELFFDSILSSGGLLVPLFLFEFLLGNFSPPPNPYAPIETGSISLFLNVFIVGFFVGCLINQPQGDQTNHFNSSWKNFVLWLAFGSAYGLVLAIMGVFFIGLFFAIVVLLMGLLIGILGGQGVMWIQQSKLRYRYINQQTKLHPLISWGRFFRGCVIGSVDGVIAGLFIFGFSALFFTIFASNDPTYPGVLSYVSATIVVCTMGGVALGLILGSIYCFGPLIVYNIEQLSEQKLGRIGVILTILGFIIAALPTLLS